MENKNGSQNRDNNPEDKTTMQQNPSTDLPDNEHDAERLKGEETTIDLPDVKDIPGQEFVHVPTLGELADTTISSADEEGEGLFDDDEENDTEIVMGTEADISKDDKRMLEGTFTMMPTTDDNNLMRATMDNEDFDGTSLNEGSFGDKRSGVDLDVPGAKDQTTTTSMGQGDEENKYYSLGGDEGEESTEGNRE